MATIPRAVMLVVLCAFAVHQVSAKERYDEELILRPLPDNFLLAHFRFTHVAAKLKHYTLFPRAISQLSKAVQFSRVDLSFTHGRWRYDKWGQPPITAPPVGAELVAHFPASMSDTALPLAWGNLTHALGGTFCASLNFLSRPGRWATRSFHMLPDGQLLPARGHVLLAALPKEPLCTENLTPWLKLLPCGDAAGLATLLHRPTIYSAAYHSMAVGIEVQHKQLQLVQSLTLVLKKSSQPPAYNPQGQRPGALPSWSMGNAFHAQLASSCPLATTSRAYVQLPAGSSISLLQPQPNASLHYQHHQQMQQIHAYDLHHLTASKQVLDIAMQPQQQPQQQQVVQPLFQVHSYTTGSGNLHGGMVLELVRQPQASRPSNTGASVASDAAALPVCIFQVVPWYVRMWVHTLQLHINGKAADLDALTVTRRLVPAQDRRQQLQLELCLALPADMQHLILTADFSKGFLTVFECPPDTHRGHDVPAAVVTYPDVTVSGWQEVECDSKVESEACIRLKASPLLQQLGAGRVQQQYSQGLLVPLAAPDFSMPYNVCCLTSTVLAIYVGATLNALMKRHSDDWRAGGKAETRKKAVEFVVVLLLFGGLALYLDDSLREQVAPVLQQLGIQLA